MKHLLCVLLVKLAILPCQAKAASVFLSQTFEEYGYYAHPTEGRKRGAGFLPDAISIRGPWDGSANASNTTGAETYAFLTTTGKLTPGAIQADGHSQNRPNTNSAYDAYQDTLNYYGSAWNIPATPNSGFTGSTGSSTDVHKMQGLTVNSIQSAPGSATVASSAPEPESHATGILGLLLLAAGNLRKRGARS